METNWGYGDGDGDVWKAFAESDKDLIEDIKHDIDDFFQKYKESLILRYNLLKH